MNVLSREQGHVWQQTALLNSRHCRRVDCHQMQVWAKDHWKDLQPKKKPQEVPQKARSFR